MREKSKQLVSLLKDDERLKSERTRALKAKERFAQATTGIGSDRTVSFHLSTDLLRCFHLIAFNCLFIAVMAFVDVII